MRHWRPPPHPTSPVADRDSPSMVSRLSTIAAVVALLLSAAATTEAVSITACYAACQSAAAGVCVATAGPSFVVCYAAKQSACAVGCGLTGAAAAGATGLITGSPIAWAVAAGVVLRYATRKKEKTFLEKAMDFAIAPEEEKMRSVLSIFKTKDSAAASEEEEDDSAFSIFLRRLKAHKSAFFPLRLW